MLVVTAFVSGQQIMFFRERINGLLEKLVGGTDLKNH